MNKRAIALLSVGHLYIDFTAGTLPILLPFIAQRFSLTYAAVGLVFAVSSFVSSISQPIFGYLADRRPAPWAMSAACIVGGVGFGLAGFAPEFWLVVLAVTVGGLAGTLFHPEGARAVPLFSRERSTTAMSFFGVGGNLGLALGPIAASILIGLWGPSGVAAIIVPGVFMAAFLLPFGRVVQQRTAARRPVSVAEAGERSRNSRLLGIGLVFAVSTLRSWVHTALFAFLPFLALAAGIAGDADGSILVSTFLIAGVVGNLIGSYLADRVDRRLVLTTTLALSAPAVYFLGGSQGFAVYGMAAMAGFLLISGFAITIVMAQEFMPRNIGMASGLVMGFAYGTGALGGMLTGRLADDFGLATAIQLLAAVAVLAAILSALVGQARFLPAAKTGVSPPATVGRRAD